MKVPFTALNAVNGTFMTLLSFISKDEFDSLYLGAEHEASS
ncbi:hypothetical protein BC739_008691 [Kutzneria viridogrisea]|uniref:Uncharacterized protein n=1 Tax=Kutzneria viridogrisea TaxID=47990 RepID=A0ABR6BX12_9PSEU|nr:hypothetical protein [Kutzneria viridogrisea]